MTDQWAIQISPKVGDALINLRAENGEQMIAILGWYQQNAATIAAALDSGRAQANVAAAFPGSQNIPQQQPWPGAPAPAPVQPAPVAPAPTGQGFGGPPTQYDISGPPGPAPMCPHGPMGWRHRTSKAGKEYKGWFCASNTEANKCDTQWVR